MIQNDSDHAGYDPCGPYGVRVSCHASMEIVRGVMAVGQGDTPRKGPVGPEMSFHGTHPAQAAMPIQTLLALLILLNWGLSV